jgi:protein gp37
MASKINYGIPNLHSWNPIKVINPQGAMSGFHCTKISEGCLRCFAEKYNLRKLGKNGSLGNGLPYDNAKRQFVIDDRVLLRAKYRPWGGSRNKQRTWFVCDLMDIFHPDVSGVLINRIWNIIFNNTGDRFLILTKRPDALVGWTEAAAECKHWPIDEIWAPHVWLGVSVCTKNELWKLDSLRRLKGNLYVSFEPLLGDLGTIDLEGISWSIIGSESGRDRRPAEHEWIRGIVDQCLSQNVKPFVKQIELECLDPDCNYEYPKFGNDNHGHLSKNPDEWPFDLRVRCHPWQR